MKRIRIVGLVFMGLALAACGGGGDDNATGNAGNGAAPAAPPAASAPAPGASAPAPGASAAAGTVAVTAKGEAIGPIASMLVAGAGGTLVSADGRLTLTVPPGALLAAQTITIQAIGNEAPGGQGLGYRLLPDGQAFAAPVKLTFNYDSGDIKGSEAIALRVAYQDAAGRWNAIKKFVLDEVAKTLSVETTHFTDWSKLLGWQLLPPFASIGAGKAVDLEVVLCATRGGGADELADLRYICTLDTEFFFVTDWAVNGVIDGNLVVGQVASSRTGTARYTAPNMAPTKPGANPVSVSAVAQDKSGRKTLLISSIWVDSHPPLQGDITSTQVSKIGTATLTHSTSASVTFKFEISEDFYRPTGGKVVSRLDYVDPVAGCEYHVAFSGAIGLQDGFIAVQDDGRYTADGVTLAPHTGTTTCTSDGKVAPLTLDQAAARWFPAPPDPVRLLRTKFGHFEGDFKWAPEHPVTKEKGTQTTVRWLLRPDSP